MESDLVLYAGSGPYLYGRSRENFEVKPQRREGIQVPGVGEKRKDLFKSAGKVDLSPQVIDGHSRKRTLLSSKSVSAVFAMFGVRVVTFGHAVGAGMCRDGLCSLYEPG